MWGNINENYEERKEIDLSVIIPLAPMEDPSELLEDLKNLPVNSEVLFSSSFANDCKCSETSIPGVKVQFIASRSGRTECMNVAAYKARGKYLLFLHADSHLEQNSLKALFKSINLYPNALLYFDLAFNKGSNPLMKLNEWGAYFRSRVLKTPFGDQGFCIRRDIFEQLGGFDTGVPYGEDHLLVRNAIRQGVPVVPVKAPLYTSPRKYERYGWFKTTATHLYLWRKQAYEDYRKYRGVNNENWYY